MGVGDDITYGPGLEEGRSTRARRGLARTGCVLPYGSNRITVSESGSGTGDTFTITENRVSSFLLPGVDWQATGGAIGTLLVYGTSHADEFLIPATSVAIPQTTVVGWSGNDTFHVGVNESLASIAGPLTITAAPYVLGVATSSASPRGADSRSGR